MQDGTESLRLPHRSSRRDADPDHRTQSRRLPRLGPRTMRRGLGRQHVHRFRLYHRCAFAGQRGLRFLLQCAVQPIRTQHGLPILQQPGCGIQCVGKPRQVETYYPPLVPCPSDISKIIDRAENAVGGKYRQLGELAAGSAVELPGTIITPFAPTRGRMELNPSRMRFFYGRPLNNMPARRTDVATDALDGSGGRQGQAGACCVGKVRPGDSPHRAPIVQRISTPEQSHLFGALVGSRGFDYGSANGRSQRTADGHFVVFVGLPSFHESRQHPVRHLRREARGLSRKGLNSG